jgi:glycosyltransferase involved in cell wall biosynthesis
MDLSRLKEKLHRNKRLKVLFLNDLGFQYGAGMAHLRQIQSFLLLGHEVKGICFMQGPEGDIPFFPHGAEGIWRGMTCLSDLHHDHGFSDTEIIESILHEVKSFEPDIVIVGNLHAAKWPLEVFLALRESSPLVVAYMHDCYLVSGGCAYPDRCRLYESGCDDSCKSTDAYPPINPAEIQAKWDLRRKIFCGPQGVPIATNSRWTLGMAKQSLEGLNHADVVYLGLDEHLFRPIKRSLARQLLQLPEDQTIVLCGATDVNVPRKGGHIFRDIVTLMNDRAGFMIFGWNSSEMEGVYAAGQIRDYQKMPLLYSAADIFMGTSLEEAFGQTLCEAAACALPIVAFNVGGVPEVARHDVNARLVDEINASALLHEIRFFMDKPDAREAFGSAGRGLVEKEFTLKKQGNRWIEYLNQVVE